MDCVICGPGFIGKCPHGGTTASNQETFTCECGHTWKFGKSGNHSCAPNYQARIASLEKENRKMLFMIDEGLGWEDMQRDSMQSHLN